MRDQTAQSLIERLPIDALRGEAICVWQQQVAPSGHAHRFRTVPDGSTELVCALGAAPLVCGPRTGPLESSVAPGSVIVGLRLRPGAAPAALHVDADELVDGEFDAAALLGDGAARRIATCESPAELTHELQRAVATRLRAPDALAVEAARRLGRGESVSGTAHGLGISERQLQRRCVRSVGVAPKALARTLRYQRFLALAALSHWPRASLARLAADAGYADQAHLTREARRLAGFTPTVVLREAAQECVGVHDHAASRAALLAG